MKTCNRCEAKIIDYPEADICEECFYGEDNREQKCSGDQLES